MKKIILLVGLGILLSVGAQAQLKVLSDGTVVSGSKFKLQDWVNVMITKSGPSGEFVMYPDIDWYLHIGNDKYRVGRVCAYDVRANNYYTWSDEKLKTNLKIVQSPMSKLLKVNGYNYNFKSEVSKGIPVMEQKRYEKLQYGFSAQEIEKIYPDLVDKSDSTGLLAVNYMGFIPILVEALKTQQQTIDALSLKVKELEAQIGTPIIKDPIIITDPIFGKEKSLQQSTTTESTNLTNAFLFQNTPNPFSQNTEIKYFIPESITSAVLYIFDLQGNMKKQINVSERNNTASVIINGSDLNAGMYIYSLTCDNQIVDTKRMILTK